MMQDFLPRMSEKKTGREEGIAWEVVIKLERKCSSQPNPSHSANNEREFSWLCVSQRGTSVCDIANWSLFLTTLQGVGIETHSSLRQYVT